MNSKVKKALFIIIGLLVFIFLGAFSLNYFFVNKIKKQISKVPENVKIQYEAIHVNSFNGNVSLNKPVVLIYEKATKSITAKVELNNFSIKGFSYWNYFMNDEIQLENVVFNSPNIIYYQKDKKESESSKDIFKNLKQILQIESLEIKNAQVKIYKVATDELVLSLKKINFSIDEIQINPKIKINPISYKNFNFTSNSVFYTLNGFENLNLESIDINSNSSKFKGLTIKTKYSKENLSNIIDVERDHYDLVVDSIDIKKQKFGFKQDSIFYFKSERVDFYQPNLKIYRDKLVKDDLSFKPLFSKMVRDLNFNLTLNSVFLNNASIVYTEKVKSDTKDGKLLFSKLNAEIKNLGNSFKPENATTFINVKSVFMDNTPIDIQWNFNVQKLDDQFTFKAKIGKLYANSMNQFMEPNENLRLKGEIEETYFTINGKNSTSNIQLKLKYEDFSVLILKENGKEKNKFLSSILNIFVSKDSKDASKDFRHGSKSNVERTMNKSVFNYLWINIKEGLLNAMTGDGEKK